LHEYPAIHHIGFTDSGRITAKAVLTAGLLGKRMLLIKRKRPDERLRPVRHVPDPQDLYAGKRCGARGGAGPLAPAIAADRGSYASPPGRFPPLPEILILLKCLLRLDKTITKSPDGEHPDVGGNSVVFLPTPFGEYLVQRESTTAELIARAYPFPNNRPTP
jgi:hypothetical protein